MKSALLSVSLAALCLSGCTATPDHMAGPAPAGDGTYLIASSGKPLSVEKVRVLEEADRFCRRQHRTVQPLALHVVDRRTKEEFSFSPKESVPNHAGVIELNFACRYLTADEKRARLGR